MFVRGDTLSAHSALPRKIPGWIVPVRENVNFLTVIPYFLGNVRCELLKFQAVRMDKYLIDLHLVGFDCFSTGARKKI